jgi:hypothetical protein
LNGRGLYLDPTDMYGAVSDKPSPGTPWPFSVDVTLAYINEPNAGQAVCNVVRTACACTLIHQVAGSIGCQCMTDVDQCPKRARE